MVEKNDLENRRFGRLTAIHILPTSGHGGRLWLCLCDCGNYCEVARGYLVRGSTESCGCLRREHAGQLKLSHGMSSSPEWESWHGLRDRCNNPNNQAYDRYGGRGIGVCDRWNNSFEAFYADMGPKPGPEYTIDRKDNDGNYEPGNCRWADGSTQQHNQGLSVRNKSGVKGVSLTKDGKHLASMRVRGKIVLNKSFDSLDDAATARKNAERLYLGSTEDEGES